MIEYRHNWRAKIATNQPEHIVFRCLDGYGNFLENN